MGSKPETLYRAELVKRIEQRLPDCFIFMLPPDQYQGVPDLLILFESKWAMLEVKISASADKEPNQDYYVDKFNEMSFAAFIWPGNEEVVLSALVERIGA